MDPVAKKTASFSLVFEHFPPGPVAQEETVKIILGEVIVPWHHCDTKTQLLHQISATMQSFFFGGGEGRYKNGVIFLLPKPTFLFYMNFDPDYFQVRA